MSKVNFKIIMFVAFLSLSASWSYAQDNETKHHSAPIPLELMFSDKGWTSQLIIDKKLAVDSRFGFFALSYLRANYDNDEYLQESLNLGLFKYDIFKGISAFAGAAYSSQWGFRPYAGGQYAYATKEFMCAIITGLYLTESNNYEAIGMIEYRPQIKGNWSLYTRAQGLYNQNTEIGKHDRSQAYGRLGVSYKTFSFGGAFNYDCYGPMKMEDHQWGIFLSTTLR